MPKEIERKFLVKGDAWREIASGTLYRQGYLSTVKERTVRVRIIGNEGFLTIKGKNIGPTRQEFEYAIPASEAGEMLKTLCEQPIIKKTRYKIEHRGLVWEIDEFEGENKGLIIAEVELEHERQRIDLPEWIGEEVTGNHQYYNANLIKHPFSRWK